MKPFRDLAYWTKRALLGVYGPATLDAENDPVQQLKREHRAEVLADGDQPPAEEVLPPVDDAVAAGRKQARANAGDPPESDLRGR